VFSHIRQRPNQTGSRSLFKIEATIALERETCIGERARCQRFTRRHVS